MIRLGDSNTRILNCQPKANYLKVKTGVNDPSISKKMRYSQYIRSAKSKPVKVLGTGPPGSETPYYMFSTGQTYTRSIVTYDSNDKIQFSTDEPNSNLTHPQAFHTHEK